MKKEIVMSLGLAIISSALAAQNAVQTSGTPAGGTVPVFGATSGGVTSVLSSPMTVSSSGNNVGFGLGTNAPAATVDVNGWARIGINSPTMPSGTVLTLGQGPTGFSVQNITNPIANGAEEILFTNTGSYTSGSTTTQGVQYAILAGGPNVSGGGGVAVHENTLTFLNLTAGKNTIVLAPNGNLGLGGSIAGSNLTGAGITVLGSNGYVGVNTTTPSAPLEVSGNAQLDGNLTLSNSTAKVTFGDSTQQTTAWTGVLCGGDYAETVNVAGDRRTYEPGDVLVIAAEDGSSDVLKSAEPYSTLVAGIYSTKPGVVGRRQTTDPKTSTTEVPMAMIGIVPTKVSAENGPIKRGDLLVTSSTLGYAMKGTDPNKLLGAVVGKSLGSLESGTGVIEVLVTLQ